MWTRSSCPRIYVRKALADDRVSMDVDRSRWTTPTVKPTGTSPDVGLVQASDELLDRRGARAAGPGVELEAVLDGLGRHVLFQEHAQGDGVF